MPRTCAAAASTVVRIDVAPPFHDQLLGAAGDEELPLREITRVASAQPTCPKGFIGGGAIGVIARHQRGPSDLDLAFDTLRAFDCIFVDDSQLVPGQSAANTDKTQGFLRRQIIRRRIRGTGTFEAIAPHDIDARTLLWIGECRAQTGLGQSIDRPHGLGPKRSGFEALREALDGRGEHRLAAAHRDPPTAQIECFDLCLARTSLTELVGEVGCGAHGSAITRDGP